MKHWHLNFFLFNFFNLFIFVCAGSLLLQGPFSSSREQGSLSSCSAEVSHCGGFSCCRAWAPGTGTQLLWCTGLVAPQRVGSSQIRDQTHVSCLRQALSLGGKATAWEGSPGRSLCLIKSSACAQGIFPTQGSNPCLLHRQAVSLPLSHQRDICIF